MRALDEQRAPLTEAESTPVRYSAAAAASALDGVG
jgi:hypothetical protein